MPRGQRWDERGIDCRRLLSRWRGCVKHVSGSIRVARENPLDLQRVRPIPTSTSGCRRRGRPDPRSRAVVSIHAERVRSHRVRGGRVRVDERQPAADDRSRWRALRPTAPVCGSTMCAPRSAVPEVATARSRPVTTVRTRARAVRVADADTPGLARSRLARQLDVTAAVDRVVARAVRGKQVAGALDRPALHHSRGVERAVRSGVDREKAFAFQGNLLAQGEHLAHLRRSSQAARAPRGRAG